MILILAEKKEVALAISDALPGQRREEADRIVQGDYIIIWLSGHTLALKEPQDYDIRYAKWALDDLPINFPNWGTKEITEDKYKQRRLHAIGDLLKQADTVIHGGDPDQEGQLLVDEVLRMYQYKGKVLRLNTSNTTKAGLQKALAAMGDNKDFESGGWSAYARSVADMIVGINMSRLFSCMNGTLLSVGRVQTPTLGLVVNRDAQIEGHQKQKYYSVFANVAFASPTIKVPAKYIPPDDAEYLVDGKILDPSEAKKVAQDLKGQALKIEVQNKEVIEKPPLPFNMIELQLYCSKRYNMELSAVMEATQSLRDKYSAITYNRSDCQYLTDDHYAEAPNTMQSVIQNIRFQPKELDMKLRSDCFNNDQVKNHPAIIPTDQKVDLSVLTENERNTYLAIAKYYMAQFLPPAKKLVTSLTARTSLGGTLKASSTRILEPGYRAIFREAEKEEETALSGLAVGEYQGYIEDTAVMDRETKPPARYTQVSLAKDMTRISKYVADPRIKHILLEKDKGKTGENGSIGTVATRTEIITGLIKKGFLYDDGKHLISTKLGRELYRILPDEIKGVDMTAEWWVVCEAITSGTASPETLQNSVLATMQRIIDDRDKYPKVDEAVIPPQKKTVGVCPRCGGNVVETKLAFSCENYTKGCKFNIWKRSKNSLMKNVTVSADQARRLLKGEVVAFKKLYSASKDKTFDAGLRLKDEPDGQFGAGFELVFDMPKEKKERSGQPRRSAPQRPAGRGRKK